MNLKYIKNLQGQITGVYIPINEWNDFKEKHQIDEKEDINIPTWHMDTVNERLADYKNHPGVGSDVDDAIDDIEKEL